MYEKNQSRSSILGSASMFYGAICCCLLIASLFMKSLDVLSWSVIMFLVMTLTFLLAFQMDRLGDREPDMAILVTGLILMVPYSIFMAVLALIIKIILIIFGKRKEE